MSAIFEHNAAVLKETNPKLFKELGAFCGTKLQLELLQQSDVTLLIDGRQLTSARDRKRQAELSLARVKLNEPLTVVGFGLGDEVRAFMAQSPQPVKVLLINPGLFYALLSIDDELWQLLQSPQVSFELYPQGKLPPRNSIIISSELYLDDSVYAEEKQRLKCLLDDDFAHRNYLQRLVWLKERVKAQESFLMGEQPFDAAEFAPVDEALVLASGPSLEDSRQTVQRLTAAGIATIAVDSALPYLSSIGLFPQYALSIDYRAFNLMQQGGRLTPSSPFLDKVMLIYDVVADASLISWFKQRRFIFNRNFINAASPLKAPLCGRLQMSGSVSTTALSLALTLGAKRIYITGMDFAYKGELSHAGTGADERIYNPLTRSDLKIMGNDGRLHTTQRNFLSYKYIIEDLIALHPEVEFINLSPCGAVIKGAPFRKL